MLERLEEEEDVHWSAHSPNIYDALSIMYNPHDNDTVDGLPDTRVPLTSPSPLSIISAIGTAAVRYGSQEPLPSADFEESSVNKKASQSISGGMLESVFIYFWALLSTLLR